MMKSMQSPTMKEAVILAYNSIRLRHVNPTGIQPQEYLHFKRVSYLEELLLEVAEGVRVLLKLQLLRAGLALELGLIEFLEESLAGAKLAVARDQALVVGLSIDESPGDA